ncbi:MAG: HAMP domain-containing histidine kinase [Bacilli bacterium]|nr:HAMP domain-containing histidine kinase [Bacilli bacterium]
MLLFVWGFETVFFSIFYSKFQQENASKVAQIIIDSDLDNPQNNGLIENLAYENSLCISVYAEYGEIKEYNTKMLGCNIKNPDVIKLIYKFITSTKSEMTYHVNAINDNPGFLYALNNEGTDIFIYAPLKENTVVSRMLHSQLIYVTFVCIIISCAVASFVSRKITEPIRSITKKATNIGKENYENAFEETGIKEIDELSETLDMVQTELGKVQTYQQDLMANVTHDLKTPLTMIKAYAEKIKDISYKDKIKLDSDIAVIVDEVDRLTVLVNDILEMSSLDQSEHNFFIEEYDLVEEIRNIINKYQIICEREDYQLITKLPKKAIIKADKKKINQVIYNLINNAINFTGDDKKVTVAIEEENKKYIVKIIDTGKGIKPKEIKNIWTKYYKNDKNHKRNVVSSGLGLSIVKTILEKHNFEYGVKSQINKGSEFYFKVDSVKQKKDVRK